nr:hypothetical protein [Mycobacterium sp. E3298]
MKTLYFEGAGMDYEANENSNVGNYRIRTAFTNKLGEEFYIELGRGYRRNEKGKTISEWALRIDFLFSFEDQRKREAAEQFNRDLYIEYRKNNISYEKWQNKKVIEPPYNRKLNHLDISKTDYTKESITEWINANLNCDFDTIEVLDMFYGYRVHADNRGYNLIDNHDVNHELASKRREAYNKVDMEYRHLLNEKYSQISLMSMDESSITIRCYASELKIGLNPREKTIQIA